MVRPYLAELEPTAEEDFVRWAQVEVASVEGVGKNSVRVAVRVLGGWELAMGWQVCRHWRPGVGVGVRGSLQKGMPDH